MVLNRQRGDLKRLGDITNVFMKYQFGPWIDGASKEHPLLKLFKKMGSYRESKNLHLSKAVRLRKTFEELGPIFIKFGQMMSSRADLFDKEYIEELSKLQDDAPPFPWAQAEGTCLAQPQHSSGLRTL